MAEHTRRCVALERKAEEAMADRQEVARALEASKQSEAHQARTMELMLQDKQEMQKRIEELEAAAERLQEEHRRVCERLAGLQATGQQELRKGLQEAQAQVAAANQHAEQVKNQLAESQARLKAADRRFAEQSQEFQQRLAAQAQRAAVTQPVPQDAGAAGKRVAELTEQLHRLSLDRQAQVAELEQVRQENALLRDQRDQAHGRAIAEAQGREAADQNIRSLQHEFVQLDAERADLAQTVASLKQAASQAASSTSPPPQPAGAPQELRSPSVDPGELRALREKLAAQAEALQDREQALRKHQQQAGVLGAELAELRAREADYNQLLQQARGTTEVVSKCTAQNRMLKEQLQEMQSEYVKVTERSMDLATKLSSAEHNNQSLLQKMNDSEGGDSSRVDARDAAADEGLSKAADELRLAKEHIQHLQQQMGALQAAADQATRAAQQAPPTDGRRRQEAAASAPSSSQPEAGEPRTPARQRIGSSGQNPFAEHEDAGTPTPTGPPMSPLSKSAVVDSLNISIQQLEMERRQLMDQSRRLAQDNADLRQRLDAQAALGSGAVPSGTAASASDGSATASPATAQAAATESDGSANAVARDGSPLNVSVAEPEGEERQQAMAPVLRRLQQENMLLQDNLDEAVAGLRHMREEKLSLAARLEQEQHLTAQLSLETETIGEYISLYHVQREKLQQRLGAKDDCIKRMNDHQLELEHRIAKLQYLTTTLADQIGAMQASSGDGTTWQRHKRRPPPPPPPRAEALAEGPRENGRAIDGALADQSDGSGASSDAFPEWEEVGSEEPGSPVNTLSRVVSDGFDEAEIGELMKPVREPQTTFYPLWQVGQMGAVSQV